MGNKFFNISGHIQLIKFPLVSIWTMQTRVLLPIAQMVKNLPAMWETGVQCLGREEPQKKRMVTHLVFLPGKVHGQRNPVGYCPWGHKDSDFNRLM